MKDMRTVTGRIGGIRRRGLAAAWILGGLVALTTSAHAAGREAVLDEATVKVCNEVILGIYRDILSVRHKYKALEQFDERALFRNPYGIFSIIYYYQGKVDPRQGVPYSFAVTVEKPEDDFFDVREGVFSRGFPVLGLKLAGYRVSHLLRSQLDILPLVDRHAEKLVRHQQNYLSVRLFLRPVKKTYYTRENIEFEAILVNVSKRNMVVQPLSRRTLYFVVGDQAWGSRTPPGARSGRVRTRLLRPGEAISKRFVAASFMRPQKVRIFGLYNVSIDGVNPQAELVLPVVEYPQ